MSVINGPLPPMYKMKPLFELSSDIPVNTAMYGMKNILSSQNAKQPQVVPSERDLLIKEIESKQSEILKALAGIRAQMAALKEALCRDNTSLESQTSRHVPPKKIDFSEYGIIHDVVVNASVQKPPYSLIGICKLWNGLVNINVSSHVHSSLMSVPANLTDFQKLCPKASNAVNLNVRLVWKDVPNDCEFIISPFKFPSLLGEVNMLRFLNRCVFSSQRDVVTETQVDEKLDICHRLKCATSGKEVYASVKALSDELGESKWFGVEGVSIVDLAAWSAVKSSVNPKLSKNLAKWFQQCEELFGTS